MAFKFNEFLSLEKNSMHYVLNKLRNSLMVNPTNIENCREGLDTGY